MPSEDRERLGDDLPDVPSVWDRLNECRDDWDIIVAYDGVLDKIVNMLVHSDKRYDADVLKGMAQDRLAKAVVVRRGKPDWADQRRKVLRGDPNYKKLKEFADVYESKTDFRNRLVQQYQTSWQEPTESLSGKPGEPDRWELMVAPGPSKELDTDTVCSLLGITEWEARILNQLLHRRKKDETYREVGLNDKERERWLTTLRDHLQAELEKLDIDRNSDPGSVAQLELFVDVLRGWEDK